MGKSWRGDSTCRLRGGVWGAVNILDHACALDVGGNYLACSQTFIYFHQSVPLDRKPSRFYADSIIYTKQIYIIYTSLD